jgi:hypothetical protein
MEATPRTPAQVEAEQYPVQLEIDYQEEYSRWMPLVKWLLAIPHFFILIFLGIGAAFALIGAFFVVLFTQRYPRGIFDYVVGVYRWGLRVTAYTYLMTDRYPAFSLDEQPDDTVRYSVAFPEEGVDWWRPLVVWLLVWPYMVVAGALTLVTGVMSFIAFFTILFTKRFPRELFDLAVVPLRWVARANAYRDWMVTRYPPWVWA